MMCVTAPRDLPFGYVGSMDERTQPAPVRDEATRDAETISPDDPTLTEYDKEVADSFPASDPPSQP
jgi:hypothetical protein